MAIKTVCILLFYDLFTQLNYFQASKIFWKWGYNMQKRSAFGLDNFKDSHFAFRTYISFFIICTNNWTA